MPYRLGKLPARYGSVSLKFSTYVNTAKLPPVPHTFGHQGLVKHYGMLENDRLGCCFAEGTLVSPGDVRGAARIPYDGPVISLQFASGKRLTVTPNHAVLTPTGFTVAALLQEGDDCIGTSGPELMKCLFGGNDGDHSPAPIEQVFTALLRGAGGASRRVPVLPSIDLDGDERFFDGDIDVVTADSLLKRESDAALGEPYRQEKIGAASELKATFHRLGATGEPFLIGGLPTKGSIRGAGHGLALIDREPIVVQREAGALLSDFIPGVYEQPTEVLAADSSFNGEVHVGLAAGAVTLEKLSQIAEFPLAANPQLLTDPTHLYASVTKPSRDGARTDPDLASNLLKRFPGPITTDRVIDIERKWLHGFVYDLSTRTRWLVSDGIITHNCVISGAGHETMLWNAEAGTHVSITNASTIRNYELFTGYTPSDPESDQGTDMQAAASRRRKTGLLDASGRYHKIGAYVALEPGNWGQLLYATYLFDGVGIGINFDDRWMDAFNNGQPWDKLRRPNYAGGHYIPAVGFDGTDIEVVTWGKLQKITQAGYQQANDETYAYLSVEKLTNGKSLEGIDLPGLTADLAAVTRV